MRQLDRLVSWSVCDYFMKAEECRPLEGCHSANKSGFSVPECFVNLCCTGWHLVHYHMCCISSAVRASYITHHQAVKYRVRPSSLLLLPALCSALRLIAAKSHLPAKKHTHSCTHTCACTHTHTHTHRCSMQPPNQKLCKLLTLPYKGCCSLHREWRR